MRAPTIDTVITATHHALTHRQRHRAKGDHHMNTLAGLADRIERTGTATCDVQYQPVETGTAYVLTCRHRGGTIIGRAVTMPAEGTSWWVSEDGVSTRVTMTAFSRRFLTPPTP